MIIAKINGGIGNQLFQYAMARNLAIIKTDTLMLDNSSYPRQTLRQYELDKYFIEQNIATAEQCDALRGRESIFHRAIRRTGIASMRKKTYIKEKERTVFDQSLSACNGSMYLDGYWQNEEYFVDIRETLLQELTPKEPLSEAAALYLAKISACNGISLHVRRGDYVHDPKTNRAHGTCSIEYYQKSIRYIQDKVGMPYFFIFSDDIEWCETAFSNLGEAVFVKGTRGGVEDLELMRNCSHNIIANSSFSWWGAWLNRNGSKIVISPRKWVNENQNESKWVPQSWLQF
jgi:Glycosyl transferase family 11